MIDLCMYRMRIGSFNTTRKAGKEWGTGGVLSSMKTPYIFTNMTLHNPSSPSPPCTLITNHDPHPDAQVLSGSLYFYFVFSFFLLSALTLIDSKFFSLDLKNFCFVLHSPWLPLKVLSHIKTAYFYIISYVI